MCSCTLHLLHEQTRSKHGLYRLYMSSEYKENMTFAFREKMSKVVQMWKFAPYLLPHCLWYKCILSPHIFCARKYFANVFFYITFACTNKRLVKAAITAVAPIVNAVLNMKFVLKQTWSKLRKCGLYAIFATHLLPARIHFFVQCNITCPAEGLGSLERKICTLPIHQIFCVFDTMLHCLINRNVPPHPTFDINSAVPA